MRATIGPFEIRERLGSGGMGEILAGSHTPTGAPIALKTIRAEHIQRSPEAMLRAFRVELEAAARMRHPGIVRIHDHGRLAAPLELDGERLEAGAPYILMERIDGGPLTRERWSWPKLRALLAGALDALAFAHARGVIHRDLKPENILTRRSTGAPVLIDFGLAHLRDRSAADTGSGTPAYMAPEQLRRGGYGEGPWTDLYALGCLAFELLVGALPFVGATHEEVLEGKLTGRPLALPSGLGPPGLEGWFERALGRSPGRRFGCAAEALGALQALHDQGPMLDLDAPARDADVKGAREGPRSLFALDTLGSWMSQPLDRAEETHAPPSADHESSPVVLPARWQAKEASMMTRPLLGAGLGLMGLQTLPMLGREDERDALWQALGVLVRQGGLAGVGLSGFAGVGKSRLARWLCHRAHELTGIAHVWIDLQPQRTLEDALRLALARALGIREPDTREHIHARVALRLGAHERLTGAVLELLRPERNQLELARVQRTAAQAIAAMARRAPLIMVLDDAHLHAGLDDLLAQLTSHLERDGGAVFAVATARRESLQAVPGHQRNFQATLDVLGAQDRELEPLDPSTHTEVLTQTLRLSEETTRSLLELTRGNPLHTTQLLGHWIDRGVIVATPDGFDRDERVALDPPGSIAEICLQRAENVAATFDNSAAAWRALERAALLGQSVPWSHWKDLCARSQAPSAEAVLAAMVRAGLAERTGQGWRFEHGLMRESLEARCRASDRWAPAHRDCHDVLREQPSSSCTLIRRASQHALEAEMWAEAVEAFYQSQNDLGADAVQDHLERIREVIPSEQHPRAEGFLSLARAAMLLMQGKLEETEHELERCARLNQTYGLELEAEILLARINLAVHRFEPSRGLELIARLEQIEGQTPEMLVSRLRSHGNFLWQLARRKDAITRIEEARALADAHGLRWERSWIEYELASLHDELGHQEQAIAHLDEAERRLAEHGGQSGVGSCHLVRSSLALRACNFEEAIRWNEEAMEAFAFAGDAGFHIAHENLIRVLIQTESFERAARELVTLEEAVARGETFEAFLRDLDLILAAHRRDWETFEALREGFFEEVGPELWGYEFVVMALLSAAELLERTGEAERARQILELIPPIWEIIQVETHTQVGILSTEERLAGLRARLELPTPEAAS